MQKLFKTSFVVALLLVLLCSFGFTGVTSAHSATAHQAVSTQLAEHAVSPLNNRVDCGWWSPHAVEIYNQGELCFEGAGTAYVNIYSVIFIKDTGNDGHAENFYCNGSSTPFLTLQVNQYASVSCSDLTRIDL